MHFPDTAMRHALLALILVFAPAPGLLRAQVEAPEAEPAPAALAPAPGALGERLTEARDEAAAFEARLAAVEALRSDARTRLAALAALDEDVHARAASGAGRLQVGAALRRAKARTPDPRVLRASSRSALREASGLDDRLFELQEEMARIGAALSRFEQEGADPQSALLSRQLERSLDAAARALSGDDGLIAALQDYATTVASLADEAEALHEFINERVLWVRSETPINSAHARAFLATADSLAAPARWTALGRALIDHGAASAFAAAGFVVALFACIALRVWSSRRLGALMREGASPERALGVGSLSWGIALIGLRAASLVAALWLGARAFRAVSVDGGALGPAIAAGLQAALIPVFLTDLLRSLFAPMPGATGQTLLHWDSRRLARARSTLSWAAPLVASLLGLYAFSRALGDDPGPRIFARVAFIGLMLTFGACAVFAIRAGRPARSPGRTAVRLLLIAAFGALAGMAALGWTFSAGVLAVRMWESALALGVVAVGRALALRWLVAVKDRAERRRAESGAEAPVHVGERAPLDPAAVYAQAVTLANLLTVIVALALLAPVWSDVFPALRRLDSLGIVPFRAIDAEALRQAGKYVLTARDALGAVVIIGVGLYAARSVPGMVDGLALARTRLDPGARYAVQTILKYSLLGVAVFLALGALRTKWGNVGWVLGGLSVGIGLGLQQFIGNFVAGLSLLFERTIRPGDLVQVGDQTGVVHDITIRATRLVDNRRRDVIVPNAMLLTGVVINQTRTDRSGIVSFDVGVAYGSDSELVGRLLTEACNAHPAITETKVRFVAFGDSSLQFRIWATIPDIDRRFEVPSDLHFAIDRAFREHGVEIPFPQRDLHVRGGELSVRISDGRDAASAGKG